MTGATILIVDDSPLIRQIVADAFKTHGHTLVSAGDGVEGLRLVAQLHPDLIIADILMPVLDGWRLCEEVRRRPETADVPFIFLSMEKEATKRVRALRLGADDYLTKPFSPDELVARAERLLARTDRIRSLSASSDRLSGHTRHLSIPDLLQILSLNGRTGALRLDGAAGPGGVIHFRDGRIIDAVAGAVRGEKALFRIMTWPECRFVLEDPLDGAEETIRGSTSAVLMDGFTHWDELRNLGDALPAPGAKYRILPRVAAFISEIELGEIERDVVAEAGKGRTVGEMLDTLRHRDLEVHRALIELVKKGFLEEIAEPAADTQPLPRARGAG